MANDISVLLVDDEDEFIVNLAERLSLRGFRVQVAHSGAKALQKISSEIFHVVVLDVIMPEMDGLQTLTAIKRLDGTLEVILLTGQTNMAVALEGIQMGAFDYLVKPVDVDELAFRLQDACEKRGLLQQQANDADT